MRLWASFFGIVDTEVLADVNYRVYSMYDSSGFIPQNIVIGRDAVIVYHDSGWNEFAVRSAIESAL